MSELRGELSDDIIDIVLSTVVQEWTEEMYTDVGFFAVDNEEREAPALSEEACAWCVVGYIRVVLAVIVPLRLMDSYEEVIVEGLESCIDEYEVYDLTSYSDAKGHGATIALIQAYQASRASTPVLSSWRLHTEGV